VRNPPPGWVNAREKKGPRWVKDRENLQPIRALSALKLERTVSERKLQSLSAKQLQSYRDALESARKRLNEMIKAVDKARK